jgi:hypothetical protein
MARVEARARELAAGYGAWVGSIRSGEGAARGSRPGSVTGREGHCHSRDSYPDPLMGDLPLYVSA